MSVYLDASVLVPMFVADTFSERADAFLRGSGTEIVVSDLAAAEFASAINRQVRMHRLTVEEGRKALANFDMWTAQNAGGVEVVAADIALAGAFLRRLDLNLRTPDAIHIAMAQRLGAELATFDERMAECALALGTKVRAT